MKQLIVPECGWKCRGSSKSSEQVTMLPIIVGSSANRLGARIATESGILPHKWHWPDDVEIRDDYFIN